MTVLWAELDKKPRKRRPVNRADLILGRIVTVLVVLTAAVWLAVVVL